MRRGLRWRAAALLTAAVPLAAQVAAATTPYAEVRGDVGLAFPADYGSHPDYRTEWWYVTGWIKTAQGEPLGFQVTLFRTRPDLAQENSSAFTPHQLIIAHGAISDPKRGRLWQDQHIGRAALGLADAAVGDTKVWVDRWRIERDGSRYHATVDGEDFAMRLDLEVRQPPLLNGGSGLSRKGPEKLAASYYYSLPHLQVTGEIRRAERTDRVSGDAWLDHEWSSEYLDPEAVGWDWIGVNLDDGGALMAFRIRDARGAARWSGGSLRDADGRVQILEPKDVAFDPGRRWLSPRTGIRYPVEWRVRAGSREFNLSPLMDDQENDTRLTTGAIYWEGAVRALEHGVVAGRGYLELTGYGEKLTLR